MAKMSMKMAMKKFESSKMNKMQDAKKGAPKEGSKKEEKMDRMAIMRMSKGKK